MWTSFNNQSDTSGGQKYAIISNESVDGDQSQPTGIFKINNQNYTFNKKLKLDAYQLDVNKYFDIKKNKGKQIRKRLLLPTPAFKVGDSKAFWVTNFATETDSQINATLIYSGTKNNV